MTGSAESAASAGRPPRGLNTRAAGGAATSEPAPRCGHQLPSR